ncbi:MAG: flagellar assembly protein A, partial [Candidatus Latescibacterota bacterium]
MAKKSFDKSIRKRIRNNAWIRLEISDNARLAFIRGMFLDGDTTIEVKNIVTTLNKEYGIVSGIDEEVLDRILSQVKSEPNRTFSSKGDVIVAQAPMPVQVRDGEIDFLFLTEKLKRNPLPYEALKKASEHSDPSSISRAGVLVRATYPGEKLAICHPHQAGKPGEDIFGRIVTPVSARLPRRVILSAGDHVREENRTFFSEIYGYVCVLDDVISVIPPIWVAPDRSVVHLIHFPQAEPVCMPQLVWLNQLLEKKELKQHLTPEDLVHIHQFVDERASRSGHMVLADGVQPVAGEDAYLILHFGSEDGNILADGRIDVVARSASLRVKNGQGIAEIVPPKEGIPGCNLMGEPIPAPMGKMCHVKITERIRVELENERPRFFYAKIDGNASYNGNTLDVRSVLRIAGDVDQQMGNIKTDQ